MYLREVVSPAELPVTISAYRRQQHRWAKGSLQCAYKLLPQVWRAPVPLAYKLESTLHLTGYTIHLYMFAMMLLYPFVIYFAQQAPQLWGLYGIAALFNISTLAPAMFFTIAQVQLGAGWWRRIPFIFFFTALGAGLMPNTVRAAWELGRGKAREFERTPKFGIQRRDQSWVSQRYKLPLDSIVLFEFAIAAWNLATLWYAFQVQNWIVAFYAGIFFAGIVFISGQALVQDLRARQYVKQTTPAAPVLDASGVDAQV